RFAGWGAAAACVLLAAGVFLHMNRQREDVLLTASSQNEEIVEVTAFTDLTETTTQTAATTSSAPVSDQRTPDTGTGQTGVTPAVTYDTQGILPPQTTPDGSAAITTAATITTTVTTETTAAPVSYPASVPVLAANGDQAGTLAEAVQFSHSAGADAVQRYLNGSEPVITLGSGQKDADTVSRILQEPEMLRIRWQTGSGCWEEYGIESAVLGKDGVLRLGICMYTGEPDAEQTDWVYETALIWEAGALPPVRDVQITLRYFTEETDSETGFPGITQWRAFDSQIQDDLKIEIQQ
ncbi:MAG: hypothetical protein IJ060_12310, partial [Oscillospiraceae bacterium]|nr:hypothetical protein [Oscillospiraceae bacterium]